MTVSLVVCVDKDYGMARGDAIPWTFPAHEEHLNSLVAKHPVVVGRKSQDLFATLDCSVQMVLSRRAENFRSLQGQRVEEDLHLALEKCKWARGGEEVFVLGGVELIEWGLVAGVFDTIYLTHISRESYDCDRFFQDRYLRENFKQTHRTVRYADKDNPARLEFVVYKRRWGDEPRDKNNTQ